MEPITSAEFKKSSQDNLEEIIRLIEKEAEAVKNPDPVSRLYNVSMRVDLRIAAMMDAIRENERRIKNGQIEK